MNDKNKFDFAEQIAPSVTSLRTAVFWNVDDFPFPTDFTADMIYSKIEDSLCKRGYGGHISIFAYAVKTAISDDMVAKCLEKRIYFMAAVPEDEYERLQKMIHDIDFWALDAAVDYSTERVNLIVIANDIQGKINLDLSIHWMTMRGCYTFLLQPAVHIPSEKPQSSVWQGCLLDGGVSTVFCSSSLDFSSPHFHMEGDWQEVGSRRKGKPINVDCFLDLETIRIPAEVGQLRSSIETALRKRDENLKAWVNLTQ